MIRINLLPVRQVKKMQAGQRQLLIFFLVVVSELVLLYFLFELKAGEVEEKQRSLSNLQTEIETLKRQVGDFDQLKTQLDRLIAQRNIINSLQKARTGPVWVLREMSDLLTMGKGPTLDQAQYELAIRNNPSSGFNPRWNPNRLWIETMVESGGNLRLSGKAKDYDDVAEFNKRLIHSRYFADEFLERNDQIMDPDLKLKVVKFSLRCRTTY